MVSRAAGLLRLASPKFGEWDEEASCLPDPPLSAEARLPPLHPKRSSHLTMLAAVNGSLLAGTHTHHDNQFGTLTLWPTHTIDPLQEVPLVYM